MGLVLPIFTSKTNLGRWFHQWKYCELFFSRTLLSLLCYVASLFSCCKKLYGLACGSKKGGKGWCQSMNDYPLLPCHVSLPLFQCFFTLFFLRHCIFQCKNTHGKGNGSTLLDIQPTSCLVNSFCSLFSNLTCFRAHFCQAARFLSNMTWSFVRVLFSPNSPTSKSIWRL